jgi:hypothetical protein
MTRTEKALALATPFVALATLAAGMRLGAPRAVHAAEVFGAPAAAAGTGFTFQVIAFEDDHGARTPLASTLLQVTAGTGATATRAVERTNDDGVAEVRFAIPSPPDRIAVTTADGRVLAEGELRRPSASSDERPAAAGAWLPFARRTGTLRIDVALVGQRAAPGFAATLAARVRDAATGTPTPAVDVSIAGDASVTASLGGRTDSLGWAVLRATPVGLAVSIEIDARSPRGADGTWVGGLVMAPGGAGIVARTRYSPDVPAEIAVDVPTARATEYVEVDDARGRAWAAALDVSATPGAPTRTAVALPKLAPGLYWAIAASTADGASAFPPSTTWRPFFVASSDDAALAIGRDALGCDPRRDARELAGALESCLALAAPAPVPRSLLVDGAPFERARLARSRMHGVVLGLAALFVAAILEVTLLLRAARAGRSALAGANEPGGARDPIGSRFILGVCVAVFVALLGFALLAVFVARAG